VGVDDYLLVYDQPVYDTVHLAIAATTATFFAVPIGGILTGAVVKSLAHTNMVQAGRLEADHTFMVEAFSMWFPECDEAGALPLWADKQAIRSGSLSFWIGDKPFSQLPAQAIPNAGFDSVLFSNITPAATEFQVSNGVSAFGNKHTLKYPLPIKPQQSFKVVLENIRGTAISAATQLGFCLWGTHTRPAS